MSANITPEGLREWADWLDDPDETPSPRPRLFPLPTIGFMLRAHAAALEDLNVATIEAANYSAKYSNMRERAERAESELARLKAPVDVAGIVSELCEESAARKSVGHHATADLTNRAAAALESLAAQVAEAKHDIEAYRGCLGYSVRGDHDGRLSNGDFPNNGISQALEQQLAKRDVDLRASSDAWHDQEEELQALRVQLAKRDAEIAALKGRAEAMHEQLRAMRLHFINTLESARDTIKLHGGECDSVEEMERRDPQLAAALKVMDAYRAAYPKE